MIGALKFPLASALRGWLTALGVALVADPALARDQYFERSGVIYDVAVDEEGVTLTSTADLMLMGYSANEGWQRPDSWRLGRQVFHVGFDCVVESETLGVGRLQNSSSWSAGFQLIFSDGTAVFEFPHQSLFANGNWFRQCAGFQPLVIPPPYSSTSKLPSQKFVSDDGDESVSAENGSGGVLTSVYPKTLGRISGPEVVWRKGLDDIYVDVSCGAFSAFWGKGKFGWANVGFLITFDGGKEIGFPLQDLPWDKLAHCELK